MKMENKFKSELQYPSLLKEILSGIPAEENTS
jgi:hypothetical protein